MFGKYIIILLPHTKNNTNFTVSKTFYKKLENKGLVELYIIHRFPYFFDQNSPPFGGRHNSGRKHSLGKHCYIALFENITSK